MRTRHQRHIASKKNISSRKRQVQRLGNRQLAFQQLDPRRVLAGYYDQIADQISGPSSPLAQVSRSLDAITSVAKLPIIGTKLEDINQFNKSLDDFRTSLDRELRQLSPTTDPLEVKEEIVKLLGPGGANVLADRVTPLPPDPNADPIGLEDVEVTLGTDSVEIVLDLGISDQSFSSAFGLGIDAVPLRPTGTTNGSFAASVFYRNFRFGYNPTRQAYIDTSASNELELVLKGYLPSSFNAGLGFLNVKVVDSTAGVGAGKEDVTIKLQANVTDTGIQAPVLSINLNFQAHVTVQTTQPGLPELATDFKLQWVLPGVAPDAPLTDAAWISPTLEFNNVTITVGSFLKQLAQPMAEYVRDIMQPLEPVFNLLEQRIPGISDIAETFGQSSINLISLSELLSLSPNPPTQFIDAMRSAAKLRDLYTTISTLADRNTDGAIRLGDFKVGGDGHSSLLTTPAALTNLGLNKWSTLVTTSGGLNFAQIQSNLRSELGDVGGEIADVLTKISSKAGGGSEKGGFSFSFPVIENPSAIAMGMFLGRDEVLVSARLDLDLKFKRDILIQIIPGVSIKIAPQGSVTAVTEIGYDTRGLRDAMQPLYTGSGFQPDKLLNGLWISSDSRIDANASVGVGPVLGFPDFVTLDVLGSVRLGVHAGLHNPLGLPKLRFFAGDFGDRLFDFSGTGTADLRATVKVGGELPLIGDISWTKSWTFAEITFFKFDSDFAPLPGSIANRVVVTPQLFAVENIGNLKALVLNSGDRAHLRGTDVDEVNEDFSVELVDYVIKIGQIPPLVPVFDVRAFGFVQRYEGNVDVVLAYMGNGDDTLHVTDWRSKISYFLHGEGDNDKINVDGNVPVFIRGGEGDDTIDGGNGTAAAGRFTFDGNSNIGGDNGHDTLTFGDGRLENLDRLGTFIVITDRTDRIQDDFIVDNARSATKAKYLFETDGGIEKLSIRPNPDDQALYSFQYDSSIRLKLLSGRGNDEFLGVPTPNSDLYGGFGDDVFRPVYPGSSLPVDLRIGANLVVRSYGNFYGQLGNDLIIADDSQNTTSRTYDWIAADSSQTMNTLIWRDEFPLAGKFGYSGIENMQLMAGSNDDTVLVNGFMTQGTLIDSGAGNDSIFIGTRYSTVRAPLTINAGAGNDNINMRNFSNAYLHYDLLQRTLPDGSTEYSVSPVGEYRTSPVVLDGGKGDNILNVDDRKRFTVFGSLYEISYDRFKVDPFFGGWADFSFTNLELNEVYLNSVPDVENQIVISSVGRLPSVEAPPTATVPLKIIGDVGKDNFVLYPHDANGQPTLLRSISLVGGTNFDTLLIDDTLATEPMSYRFDGLSDGILYSQNISGITSDQLELSSNITSVQLVAANVKNKFSLDFTGFIQSLNLSGGTSDDEFEISNETKNLSSAIGLGTALAVDGGGGNNSIKLFNNNNVYPWEYSRTGNNFTARSPAQSVNFRSTITGVQSWELSGGLEDEVFNLDTIGADERLTFSGNQGQDALVMGGSTGTVSAIAGYVFFDAGPDGGQARVTNHNDTRGVVAHIVGTSDTLLGIIDGDTLFAPGGSARLRNLRNFPIFTDAPGSYGLYMGLGSGTDTVFTEPQANYSLRFSGADPTTTPGDTLHLSLANAQSPVISNGLFGVSTLDSSNRQTVRWSSFESLDTQFVAPNYLLVSNADDSGPGSLRQAIIDANAAANTATADVILFDLPGRSTHTITLATALPAITDAVVLDATTQPGYTGQPLIELDGSHVRDHGLVLLSGGNTIRGLAINRFVAEASAGIWIAGPGGNRIQGNFIGTNLAGDAINPAGQQQTYGIVVFGSDNNIIGTDGNGVNDAWEGNLLSGQNTAGLKLVTGQPGELPDNNVIAGNRIGTSADGRSVLGNGRMGVFISSPGSGNRIGTNADGVSDTFERNIISGNDEAGLYVTGTNSLIAGNFIGTDIDGVRPLPNGDGIVLNSASGNSIGGTLAASANVIAFNRNSGINVLSGTSNSILGNSIFQNDQLGINLSSANDPANFVTPNDDRDLDTGANNLQNYPVLSQVLLSDGQTIIGGSLVSSASKSYRIEFFANAANDPSGYGEGQRYLGFVDVSTNSRGQASFTFTTAALAAGQFVTATATDNLGNTSEFALSKPVILAASVTNVVILQVPGGGTVILTAPVGSSLTASVKTTASVPPPAALSFGNGYFDIQLTGIAPGAAADIVVTGLNLPQFRGYYLYGRPASNRSAQWYNFELPNGNAGGNSAGTGAEIIGGNLVLHLIDGKRGDSDLRADGVIRLFGGATFNRAPTAVEDSFTTAEDTVLTISSNSLRRNDSDADGDQLTILLVGAAVGGSVSLNNDVIRFVPQADYFGPASFKYTLSDGSLTTIGRVLINVTEVNDPPIANTDRITIDEDRSRVEIDVLRNDVRGPSNEFRQTLTVISAEATIGSVRIRPDGGLVYRPRENYFGTDTIRYRIEDNGRTAGRADPRRATGTVTITITSVNDAPIATDQSLTVSDQGRVTLSLRGNDVETPQRHLIFTLTALPTQGTVQTENGSFVNVGDRFTGPVNLVYQPGLIFDGSQADLVKFQVSDDASPTPASDEGQITIGSTMRSASANLDSSGILRIAGTNRNDDLKVTRSGDRTLIYLNQQLIADRISWSNVREVRVWAREGDDTVDLSAIDVPTVIVGGNGSDILRGGQNADLVFGGLGEDQLFDNRGDDVLLGNQLNASVTMDVARQVLSQWRTRRATNDAFRAAVVDDLVKDALRDGEGDDWSLLTARDVRFDDVRSDRDVLT